MKLTSLRKSRTDPRPGLSGTARLDRRTRHLARRIRPGDIAVIDHVDMDRGAAAALVDAGVAAVVNLAPSISGRYPNLGPSVLLDAGVVLIDEVGRDAFMAINDGDRIRIDGETIYKGDVAVARGTRQDTASVEAALEESKEGLASHLEAFSANAIEHLRRERGLLLDGEGVPSLDTTVGDRHVLVVSRAFDYQQDLRSLRTYIRENAPVLIGVDAGADALIEAGYRPDVIVTPVDEISDTALRSSAEIIAHATPAGRIPGQERLERLGVTHTVFRAGGTSEDAAILLAHAHKARLIVTAGSHATLLEYLDKGRSGMASSFLTRASVGPTVVDAKAVSTLYRNRVPGWLVLVCLLVALGVVVAAIGTTPVGQDWWEQIKDWADQSWTWIREQTS
ncbi:MAG: putative cytokinetic ring protein SteA [Nocardioidaceae bacterium]